VLKRGELRPTIQKRRMLSPIAREKINENLRKTTSTEGGVVWGTAPISQSSRREKGGERKEGLRGGDFFRGEGNP